MMLCLYMNLYLSVKTVQHIDTHTPKIHEANHL